ncbi:hypothetical protein Bbelb_233140 [Branchiostoma belcheri]|nr:hypothetical protein Bbelb_233140 [Branchiostoma belcheri]
MTLLDRPHSNPGSATLDAFIGPLCHGRPRRGNEPGGNARSDVDLRVMDERPSCNLCRVPKPRPLPSPQITAALDTTFTEQSWKWGNAFKMLRAVHKTLSAPSGLSLPGGRQGGVRGGGSVRQAGSSRLWVRECAVQGAQGSGLRANKTLSSR